MTLPSPIPQTPIDYPYDPTGDYLRPPLQGWRLNGHGYDPIPIQSTNGALVLYSEVLELEVRAELRRGELRFYDRKTGQRLQSLEEEHEARRAAETRAAEAEARVSQEVAARREAEARSAQEAEARRALAEEVERLRAELSRVRGSDKP